MQHDIVLVRTSGGKPARLVAIQRGPGLVYVANPTSVARIAAGVSWPVGFPEEDVFVFDEGAYDDLRHRWERKGALSLDDWRRHKLKRYVLA